MNAATETSETSFEAPAAAPHPVRPFYWSVRRELWENRSLMIVPAVVGGLALLALLGRVVAHPGDFAPLATLEPEQLSKMTAFFYAIISFGISAVMHVAVFFYLIDALQGERKDRSVLFWKSMPVSDTTTVLSKLFTGLVVSGAIVVVASLATVVGGLLILSVVMLIGGGNPIPRWANLSLIEMIVAVVYWQMIAMVLWYAPLAAWLLLVSAWAKRVTILWAVLTPVAVTVVERVALGTHYVQNMINSRLQDPTVQRFVSGARGADLTIGEKGLRHGMPMSDPFASIDPIAFFSNPWLWVGLVVAAGFVAAAIWMRRYREPL
jgi:ABC-2 type transport system permease protein